MILFVGDKPSLKMKPGAKPFEGAACEARLHSWCIRLADSYELFNSSQYIDMTCIIMRHTIHQDKIVALGNNASKRLTKYGIPHFKLPHPSGRNRQLNDKSYIESRLAECKKYICDFSKV